jgi:L-asparaginase
MIKILVHGGIDSAKSYKNKQKQRQEALDEVAKEAYKFLENNSALNTVEYAVSLLEDIPLFNAGTGSVFQEDGKIRMSASIMDGKTQNFAGVINIENVKNPIKIAKLLLPFEDKVLSGNFASEFAWKNGFEFYSPETLEAFENFVKNKTKKRLGTVGAVAIDEAGNLAAATSTGGKGNTLAGRVSDSCTVAGNYANKFAAISATGVGEDIVNVALSAKIATRIEDGMDIIKATNLSINELKQNNGYAGFIALDYNGNYVAKGVKNYLYFSVK